jgi:hypothetical protein
MVPGLRREDHGDQAVPVEIGMQSRVLDLDDKVHPVFSPKLHTPSCTPLSHSLSSPAPWCARSTTLLRARRSRGRAAR